MLPPLKTEKMLVVDGTLLESKMHWFLRTDDLHGSMTFKLNSSLTTKFIQIQVLLPPLKAEKMLVVDGILSESQILGVNLRWAWLWIHKEKLWNYHCQNMIGPVYLLFISKFKHGESFIIFGLFVTWHSDTVRWNSFCRSILIFN